MFNLRRHISHVFLLPAHFFHLTFKLTHFELIKFILNKW